MKPLIVGWARCMSVAALVAGSATGTVLAQDDETRRLRNDLPVPVDDPAAIEQGRLRFAERCAFCHGGGGKGGKGPCLTCGRFKYGGKASNLYANIANGVPMTQMGAFGSTMSREEILNIIAYLRDEYRKRKETGELD